MKKRSGGKFLDKYKRREILWQKLFGKGENI